MEFEIEKDLFAAADQLANVGRDNGSDELLANFLEADGFAELVYELARLIGIGKVKRHDQTLAAIFHGNRITQREESKRKSIAGWKAWDSTGCLSGGWGLSLRSR